MREMEGADRWYGQLNSEQVAALDHAAAECGVSVTQLMEIAGWQVARCAWELLEEERRRNAAILVLAGRGNNGGDGLVAARHLSTWDFRVRAQVVADKAALGDLLATHVESARRNGVIVTVDADPASAAAALEQDALVIDGLLGTGLHAAPREPIASVIRALNDSGRRVLAIDVPSGLDATSGEAYEPCVHATWTCTLAAMKEGLWRSGEAHSGPTWIADIGMPAAAWAMAGLQQPLGPRGGLLLQIPSRS